MTSNRGGGTVRLAILRAAILFVISGVFLARSATAQTTVPVTAPTCPASIYQVGSTTYAVPCSLNLLFTTSTAASGRTPLFFGVNSGHNNDTSWVTYLKRLNGNGLRM